MVLGEDSQILLVARRPARSVTLRQKPPPWTKVPIPPMIGPGQRPLSPYAAGPGQVSRCVPSPSLRPCPRRRARGNRRRDRSNRSSFQRLAPLLPPLTTRTGLLATILNGFTPPSA